MKKNKFFKTKKKAVLSLEEKRALEKMNRFKITSTTKVPEEVCVFKVEGVGCMALGDLSAVKAEPKNGKTTALKWICATVLTRQLGILESDLDNPLILWIDTEQKKADAKLIIEDIRKITGLSNKYLDKHLILYSLRKVDSKTMREEMKAAIKEYQPEVVVIDGIAEFVDSVNDESEAKQLILQLMKVSEENHCAIICVLHENRNGNRDMKGHLGAQLTQKVGNVVECKKSGDIITVKCTDSRHKETPMWSIRFDENGKIVDANGYISPIQRNARPSSKTNRKQQADAQEKKERLDFCLSAIQEDNGSIAKKELIQQLMNNEGISRSRASALLTEFINENKLFINGKNITSTPSTPSEAVAS